MTFKELLSKWHGKNTGAQTALANALGVKPNTVSHWTRNQAPSEDLQPRVAQLLGVSVEELLSLFAEDRPTIDSVMTRLDAAVQRLEGVVDRMEGKRKEPHSGDTFRDPGGSVNVRIGGSGTAESKEQIGRRKQREGGRRA